jgi:hypothetical protein
MVNNFFRRPDATSLTASNYNTVFYGQLYKYIYGYRAKATQLSTAADRLMRKYIAIAKLRLMTINFHRLVWSGFLVFI